MAKNQDKPERRKNRDKAAIAQSNLNAEIGRQAKAEARKRRLEAELEDVKTRIEQHDLRIAYLKQNPDLPKPEGAGGDADAVG